MSYTYSTGLSVKDNSAISSNSHFLGEGSHNNTLKMRMKESQHEKEKFRDHLKMLKGSLNTVITTFSLAQGTCITNFNQF